MIIPTTKKSNVYGSWVRIKIPKDPYDGVKTLKRKGMRYLGLGLIYMYIMYLLYKLQFEELRYRMGSVIFIDPSTVPSLLYGKLQLR